MLARVSHGATTVILPQTDKDIPPALVPCRGSLFMQVTVGGSRTTSTAPASFKVDFDIRQQVAAASKAGTSSPNIILLIKTRRVDRPEDCPPLTEQEEKMWRTDDFEWVLTLRRLYKRPGLLELQSAVIRDVT